MPNTTNYNWDIPADTDLVKDGAAAIRTLGSSIDTTTKNLNPETTLGDISYRSATANTKTRLAIGTTGQVLTVSGGVPAWAAVSADSMTLITSGNMSSTGVTISAIPGTYKDLIVYIKNPFVNVGDDLAMRLNGDTNNRYNWIVDNTTATIRQSALNDHIRFVSSTNLPTTSVGVFAQARLFDYANTSTYQLISTSYTDLSQTITAMGSAGYNQLGAITSIFIGTDGGTSTFSGGTYELYGVK